MIANNGIFQRALIGSSVLHVLFFGVLTLLPTGDPGSDLAVYTVRVLEVPARPSTNDLNLAAPSLNPDMPPATELETPEAPALDVPRPAALITPETPAPQTPESAVPLPPSTQSDAAVLPPPGPPKTGAADEPPPQTSPAVQPPAALPQLPTAPQTAPQVVPPEASPAPPAAPSPPAPPAITPPDAPPALPEDRMSRLKSRVDKAQLEVELTPGINKKPTTEQSLFSLRIFNNRVREAVKENYSFPGGFSSELRTRVRVTLNRDGTLRESTLLETSGNERFDRLVCLAAINKARFPHVPEEIEGENLSFNITCTP